MANSAIAGIFPIGDTGESFGVAEWVPDPEVLQAELFKLAADLENMAEPMEEARAAFIYSTELHFETETDPQGNKWEPLKQSTIEDKQRHGYPEDILVRTSDLKRAATSQEAWLISERAIMFDSGVLPLNAAGDSYGFFHQEGSKGWHLAQKWVSGATLTAEEEQAFGTVGSGNALPQRQFIGADEDTIAEVEEIFLKWINRTVEKDFGGPVQGLGFGINSAGTFPIISFTSTGQPILRTPSGPRFGRRS